MPDEKFAYAGGMGLFQSKTGGSSFSEVKLPGSGGGLFDVIFLESVFAYDRNHVVGVSEDKVYWTPNSLNWEVTQPTTGVTFSTVHFVDPLHGWIGGGFAEEITETDPYTGEEKVVGYDYQPKGLVMETVDGGKSFAPLVVGAAEYFKHLTFVSPMIGLAVTASNDIAWTIKRSTDGGKSWVGSAIPAPPEGMEWLHLSRIEMVSLGEGWVAGATGYPGSDLENLGNKAVVLRTMDGGVSWEYVNEAEGAGGYVDIDFAGPDWGWVVGTFGKIVAHTDGTEWVPPDKPEPEADIVDQPGLDTVEEDVPVWGQLFGVFGDEVLIGENSYPGGNTGGINAGKDDPECEIVTRGIGCSAGSSSPWSAVLLLVPLMIPLIIRARATRWEESAIENRKSKIGTVLALSALLLSCSETETVKQCEELPPPNHPSSDALGADSESRFAEFRCGLVSDMTPTTFAPVDGRTAAPEDMIALVQTNEAGGTDLYLSSRDRKTLVQLTEFNDPAVQVSSPSWSPDRSHIAFVSSFRSQFNIHGNNLFVISLDRLACYQLTPGVEAASIRDEAELTATVTGSLRYGAGAIANPVPGAVVAFPGGKQTAQTGSAGEFIANVPPGKGTLVLRGTVNGMQVKGVAEFEVEAGKSLDLGPVMATVEAEYRLGRPAWSHDGMRLFAFESEQLERLIEVDANTGEVASYLENEDDKVILFSPFPDEAMAVVAFKSDPTAYFVYSLADPPSVLHQFTFEGQTETSVAALSPMRFLATLQNDRLVLLGSDSSGHLRTEDVTPDNLSGLVPGQLDWSPDGTSVLVTVSTAGKTNLMLVDVNTRTAKALTTDGTSAMPAWYGF